MLCACSPAVSSNDAAQDAATELAVLDSQALTDATVLDAPSDAGPETTVDAAPELGVDAGPEASVEAGPPLPWVRDFGTDYSTDTVEVLFNYVGSSFETNAVSPSGTVGRSGCMLFGGLVQFAATVTTAPATTGGRPLSASMTPAGPAGTLHADDSDYSAPTQATLQITRTRSYVASGVTRANYYVSFAVPHGITGVPGRTADPTLGEIRLFGCPVM